MRVLRIACLLILSYGILFVHADSFLSGRSAKHHRLAAAHKDLLTIQQRRISTIIGAVADISGISSWLQTLDADGKWSDPNIDYTSGCPARRANWPAQEHWERLVIMSAAWHGGVTAPNSDGYVKSSRLRSAISLAMDYWFKNDFTNTACIDSGGTPACPCGTPGLWNTNWYASIIGIPILVGEACLVLNDTLLPAQLNHCVLITGRAYGTFDHSINGAGYLTGANTLDVASIGLNQALLTSNISMVTDAYRRVHAEVAIINNIKGDGIRPDGSFGQHGGILYNGNYGKDYLNDVMDLEVAAGGTQYTAPASSRQAIATLVDGDRWMIYRNILTGTLHWDFSALGRFISFPVIDRQATSSIKLNLTQLRELGEAWNSTPLINTAEELSQGTESSNASQLVGNRMFYANDYMVHRGKNYITTVKMFSSRTQNTECTNTQNPLGFHLSDGVVHTYLQGNEYEDIAVAWDWNMIPGITIDYGATVLECSHTQFTGIESFVGGVSTGHVGVAAMRYTNPITRSLHWQKTWFFLDDDVQLVMVSDVSSSTDASVYSVLDQRLRNGSAFVDGSAVTAFNGTGVGFLWHGKIGYVFPPSENSLSVQIGMRTGSWAAIGTSVQPTATVDLFAALFTHESLDAPISYTALPGLDYSKFQAKRNSLRLEILQNDEEVSAIFDRQFNTIYAVFWNVQGGTITFASSPDDADITLASTANSAIIYVLDAGNITVSDPSQTVGKVEVTLRVTGEGKKPPHWRDGDSTTLLFTLPNGGLAGSSVSQVIFT